MTSWTVFAQHPYGGGGIPRTFRPKSPTSGIISSYVVGHEPKMRLPKVQWNHQALHQTAAGKEGGGGITPHRTREPQKKEASASKSVERAFAVSLFFQPDTGCHIGRVESKIKKNKKSPDLLLQTRIIIWALYYRASGGFAAAHRLPGSDRWDTAHSFFLSVCFEGGQKKQGEEKQPVNMSKKYSGVTLFVFFFFGL